MVGGNLIAKRRLIVIISVTTMVSLVLLTVYVCVTVVELDLTKDVVGVIKDLMTIVAVLVGGAWAYFNFFKGRIYRPRLESGVTGKFVAKDGKTYLSITAHLKNVGLSDVQIKDDGTALVILLYQSAAGAENMVRDVQRESVGAFSVFNAHHWIEPNELIQDHRLIALPNSDWVAVRVELRVVSIGIEWNSAVILEHSPTADAAQTRSSPERFTSERVLGPKGGLN